MYFIKKKESVLDKVKVDSLLWKLLYKPYKKLNLAARHFRKGKKPDFIIIGAQKSGTSSLYHYLIQHPFIESAAQKETCFFSDWRNESRGVDWYFKYFPDKGGRLSGEASPTYMFDGGCADKIMCAVPDVKIIAILRDPIDRAYSNYKHAVRKGKENRSFGEGIEYEGEEAYRTRGEYYDILKDYYKVFPKENIFIIQAEKMFKDPENELNRVFRFLHLPDHKLEKYYQMQKGDYSVPIDPDIKEKLRRHYAPWNKKLFKLIDQKFNWK